MYKGEINIEHRDLPGILRAANALKIRGLVDVCSGGGTDLSNLTGNDQVRK